MRDWWCCRSCCSPACSDNRFRASRPAWGCARLAADG
ncbi:MAG: hypothetical protein ACKVSF_06895 [Alphaproteobacteria bacterium]